MRHAGSVAYDVRVSTNDDPDTIEAVSLAAAPYLTRGVELTELLGALVDTVVAQLRADKGTLYLKDGGASCIRSVITDVKGGIHLALGEGLAGSVAQTGELINVSDVQHDARFDPATDLRTGYVTRSMLALPVRDTAAEVIGVLQILNAASGTFTKADETAALNLAKQAGAVLERTSLYAELKAKSATENTDRPPLAYRYNQIVGESDAMRAVYMVVEKAARTDATVLITGESGTGKELFARAIHHNSARRGGPFVKVDCTTLPEALIENELFGHERGAYTGADKASVGKFEAAAGGTLFIDEIGELPLKLQGKLLRVLQDREFERVGGTKTITADVRVVCATHRDLAAMVDAGDFREDLYYRVKVVPLHTPALRERGVPDLLRLIDHFVSSYARRYGRRSVRLGAQALQRLKAHTFPGNIRELEHVIESAVVMCDGDVIEARDLALSERGRRAITQPTMPVVQLISSSQPPQVEVGNPEVTLSQVESEHIRLVLEACKGNQSEAARKLGIGRNTLARKLSGEPDDQQR